MIENDIAAALTGVERSDALAFATFLREHGAEFEHGTGYWADKRYWMAKYQDEYVCFILLNGYDSVRHKGEPEGWIIWLSNSGFSRLVEVISDESLKKIAWKYIDICGNCGGCGNQGGSCKTLFGKKFDNVCITPMRFDNPNAATVECVKTLIGLVCGFSL